MGMPDQTFFVRQIAREIRTSVGSVQRELETLSEVGLLDRTMIGRQRLDSGSTPIKLLHQFALRGGLEVDQHVVSS
jgi:predicted transcriptional regulator